MTGHSQSPAEWENEVYQTKVADRLLLIKNQSQKKFVEALALVDQTDELISTGGQLAVFVANRSLAAETFVAALGYTLDDILIIEGDNAKPHDYFLTAPNRVVD